ncbi:LacI family transcriptional regulator [Homoserinibacter sp. GY 40078]|nr:LacI family transcriptional regulator [Homoserinibacter sp. GY 40078]
MADVARLAGVSVPTVSRVINDADHVTPEKRARVREAIERLRYRPSAAARTLASRQSRTIAVVAGDTMQYGYAATIRGIEEAARADGFAVTITVIDSADASDVSRTAAAVQGQAPAGIVVLKFDPPGVAALAELRDSAPIVAVSGVRGRDVPQAVLDELHAAQALTAHLLELGHATVHHVRVPPSRKEDGRTTGWRAALRAAGAEIPATYDASWDPESGREIGHRIAEDAHVTAVFCGNDEIAMGVIKGLTERGLTVPDDVSVAGFDDHPLAAVWNPALTTARQDFVALGRRAYGLLRSAISGDESARWSSERPPVIVRESTGPAPGKRRTPLS